MTEIDAGLRVLVACEYSGVVRDAFIRAGPGATSRMVTEVSITSVYPPALTEGGEGQ